MPEISVIIPVYNKEKYVAATIQSLLVQTMKDFELLIINDGSADNSLQIIRSYEEKDARIRVMDVVNGGVSRARNHGLDAAAGRYITFVDADDTVHPDYLRNMYQMMRLHDVDMVISGVEKYWCDRQERIAVHAPFEGRRTMEEILPVFAEIQKQTGIFGMCVSKLFSRALVGGQRFDEPLVLGEDFDFYLRLYEKVNTVFFDSKCLYSYLQEADNSSVQISDEKIDYCAQFQINLRYRCFLQKRGSYTGENQSIVNQQLSDYLFFALHYCPKQQFRARFRTLRMLCKTYRVTYSGVSVWQKLVLGVFRCNAPGPARVMIGSYHTLRKWIGGRS